MVSIPDPTSAGSISHPTAIPSELAAKGCASVYAGGSGKYGFVGPTTLAFAELSTNYQTAGPWDFSALGNLPAKTKVLLKYHGRHVYAEKLDVGRGGPGCGGHKRVIDLAPATAAALGFPGLDVVEYLVEVTPTERKRLETEFPKGYGANIPGGVKDAISGLTDWGRELAKVLNFLGSSAGWARIGKVVGGSVLLMIALAELGKIGTGSEANIKGTIQKTLIG